VQLCYCHLVILRTALQHLYIAQLAHLDLAAQLLIMIEEACMYEFVVLCESHNGDRCSLLLETAVAC
jgi:hypothetical protein